MCKEGRELIWILAIAFVCALLYTLLVENKIVEPDNAVEEAVEDLIEERSGIKIDITPGVGYDREFEDMDARKR